MNDAHVSALFRDARDRDGQQSTAEEPVLPADFAEATLARARRSVRRRRIAGTVGTATLVLLLVATIAVVPWPGREPDQTPAEPTTPSLPEIFPELSIFTSRAVDDPAGPAIALYGYGDVEGPFQTLVAGAERDTYRRVDTAEAVSPDVLLSPDGRYVLYFRASRGTDEFRLLDLTTGRSEVRHSVEWISYLDATISLLAWSPDGRYVAYAVPHPPVTDGQWEVVMRGNVPLRDVAILDVVNDTNVLFPLNTPVFGAAFSPDSQRVAVLGDPESPIISVDGIQVGTWPAPDMSGRQWDAVLSLAWSPDGTLLAVSHMPILFVDMAGTGQTVSTRVAGGVLGWRSPTSIVVRTSVDEDLARGDRGVDAVVEVSIVDGSETVLSRFPRVANCTFTGRCKLWGIQLATKLLPRAGIRPSNPDRGPWAAVVPAGLIVAAVLIAVALVALVVWRHRARRRSASHRVGAASP